MYGLQSIDSQMNNETAQCHDFVLVFSSIVIGAYYDAAQHILTWDDFLARSVGSQQGWMVHWATSVGGAGNDERVLLVKFTPHTGEKSERATTLLTIEWFLIHPPDLGAQ